MKRFLPSLCIVSACLFTFGARAQLTEPWDFRFDIGGSIPQSANLKHSSGELELNAGFTMNFALSYRLQPWLSVGPELGLNFNTVDSFAGYKPSSGADLFQMPMMLNLMVEYPPDSRLRPFAGIGIGGVVSVLSSEYGYYSGYWYYWEDYSTDTDVTWAAQAFAGIRYDLSDRMSVGLLYRFLATASQEWTFTEQYWSDPWTYRSVRYDVEVDSIQNHSISLLFSWQF